MITRDVYRGIRTYQWSELGQVLYLQDDGGDENFQLFLADVETEETTALTRLEGGRVDDVFTSVARPGVVALSHNGRDATVFDLYHLDLKTREMRLLAQNTGDVVEWAVDSELEPLSAVAARADGLRELRVPADDGWHTVVEWTDEDTLSVLERAGDRLLALSSLDADATRLVELRPDGSAKVVFECASGDVHAVLRHPRSRVVEAVACNVESVRWHVLESVAYADRLRDALEPESAAVGLEERALVSRDAADAVWVIEVNSDVRSVRWTLEAGVPLFSSRPDLDEYRLTPRRPVQIRARDGELLHGYLTRPRPDAPGPMVLLVHGGPWARSVAGYHAYTQLMASRGIAVLDVNFRGSAGFGKRFLHLGDTQWGTGTMQHDLSDAAMWAVEAGVAAPGRTCILGGSYGGYATLAGLTFTPELYACGVDIVGPSNLQTLFASIPPYWKPLKRQLQARVGDVEADDDLNRAISPLFHVDAIRAPLLIGQGRNDPRVKVAESTQIYEAAKVRGIDVDLVIYDDEGHGFARPTNALDFASRVEAFLLKHLNP